LCGAIRGSYIRTSVPHVNRKMKGSYHASGIGASTLSSADWRTNRKSEEVKLACDVLVCGKRTDIPTHGMFQSSQRLALRRSEISAQLPLRLYQALQKRANAGNRTGTSVLKGL
jgi:hypothetical protein